MSRPRPTRGAVRSRRRRHGRRPPDNGPRPLRRSTQDLLADVERREQGQRAGGVERVEEQRRLLRGARAELDECRAPVSSAISGAPAQDRPLGAGRVVLGQARDLVEQARSQLVVQPLGRELLRLLAQAPERLVEERGATVVRPEEHLDADPRGGGGRLRHPGHTGSRRRSAAVAGSPSCGRWAGRRAGRRPTSRRAARGTRRRRRPREYSAYGNGVKPG